MGFEDCVRRHNSILMEGALGERLKREYNLSFDENIAMAKLIYCPEGQYALKKLWLEYLCIARKYGHFQRQPEWRRRWKPQGG